MTSQDKLKKWVRCKIKNIAVLNKTRDFQTRETYLILSNILPNNCIRLNSAMGWCYNSCGNGVCRECKDE